MPPASSKKRTASTFANDVGGPPSKKVIVSEKDLSSKSKSKAKAKGKAKDVEPKAKTRRKPITAPESDGTDSDEDEGGGEEMMGELDDDEYPAETGPDDMDVDSAPQVVKDPNASRESHKVQKELLSQRKAHKPNAELIKSANSLWSLANKKNITPAERRKHVEALMNIVRGKLQDIVFKHEASRIVQTLIKYGSQKERDAVALELKGKYKELSQNKYAKFLVTKLIRYCPTHRTSILSEFRTHVLRLLLHREASQIISDAFELYSNASDRSILLRDFYGKEVALFGDSDGKSGGLEEVLKGADEERRKRVLGALKENLINIFNNPDKGAVSHSIVHRALWEYLSELNRLSDETEKEKLRREIFDSCQELVAEMVHTKDGSRSVREFLAQGTAKDRKQVIKVLKPHLERMCKDEEAQTVLFTALDVVDDTKMMAKSVILDIIAHAQTFAFDSHKSGRRVLFYLLVPRSKRHFTPAIINSLASTDPARERTSKKDPQVRAKEILEASSEGLIKCVETKGEEMVRDPGASLLVGEIMLYADGDKTKAVDALLGPISKPYAKPAKGAEPSETSHILDLPHSSRLYKTLVQGGHFDRSTSSIERVSTWSPSVFASAFLEAAGPANIIEMAKGGCTFLIAELVDRITQEGSEEEKKTMRQWFGKAQRKEIEAEGPQGVKVLLEKLTALDASIP